MFLKIHSTDGSCHHIKMDQISLLFRDNNKQCWILIGQHSIQIGEHEYDTLIDKFNTWWTIEEIKSQNKIPMDLKIEDLQLTIRTANCFKNMGVVYVHQLLKKTDVDLLRSKNFGRKSLNEIKEILRDRFDAKLGELK